MHSMSNAGENIVALNNHLQSKQQASLLSWADSPSGPRHLPQWTSTCNIAGKGVWVGTGTHKHIARDAAATAALAALIQSDVGQDTATS
ncbi:hypothetical protein A0H81_11597 [Grifola frondosa]|uniref:DRBM domain-containing protein n=1 Tax=Grifola frondosa TaxID=5627 RepID=A0A1C7LUS3_GRIFR|nr:hypothetical protein A0H81_11597 [Grifola frondosa]